MAVPILKLILGTMAIAIRNFGKVTTLSSQKAGFTLTELLLAASLTSVVIGAATFGLVAMLGDYTSKDTKLVQQRDLHRAIDFMAEEVRRAVNIERDAAIAFNEAKNTPGLRFNPPANAKAVLALDLPGVADEIFYYVTEPKSSSPWLGPQVIYRFGPNLNRRGAYTNASDPTRWTVEPLVDRIDDTAIAPSCANGDIPNPPDGVKGFYACVNPTGELVQIYLNSTSADGTEQYSATTQVFIRAEDAPAPAAPPSAFTSSVLPFNISGGTLVLNTPANVTVRVLGSATQCSGMQSAIPVTTQLILDGQPSEQLLTNGNSLTLPSGTARTLRLSATASGNLPREGCEYNFTASSADSTQVYALFNGDTVSDIPSLADPDRTASFLQNYIVNGTVSLQANQILYLFEMEATSKTDSAYDLQDHAVLITLD